MAFKPSSGRHRGPVSISFQGTAEAKKDGGDLSMRKFGKETFQIKKNGAKKEKEKKRRERLQKRRFMRFGLLQSGKRRGS